LPQTELIKVVKKKKKQRQTEVHVTVDFRWCNHGAIMVRSGTIRHTRGNFFLEGHATLGMIVNLAKLLSQAKWGEWWEAN
jgi:hypothetical protein